jgi:rare lipoprotein A
MKNISSNGNSPLLAAFKALRPSPENAPKNLRASTILLRLAIVALLTGCHNVKQAPPSVAYTAPDAGSVDDSLPVGRSNPRFPASSEIEGRPTVTLVGLASWYGPPTPNRRSADGSVFNTNQLTAANRTLPFGTIVRVTNLATRESVVVKITDRGPFVPGRELDLSLAAAKAIGVYRMGVAKVKIEAFEPSTADPDGRWCVQIGAFSSARDANRLKNELLKRYSTAKVIEFASASGNWVRIDPAIANRASALRIANSIRDSEAEAYLVRLN